MNPPVRDDKRLLSPPHIYVFRNTVQTPAFVDGTPSSASACLPRGVNEDLSERYSKVYTDMDAETLQRYIRVYDCVPETCAATNRQ